MGAAAAAATSRSPGLPPELAGLRIVHLSDFHLGVPSRGAHAVERAARWAAERRARPRLRDRRPRSRTRAASRRSADCPRRRCRRPYAVLGNHDYGIARDPFAQRAAPFALPPPHRLLGDEGVTLELRGRPRPARRRRPAHVSRAARRGPGRLADPDADLRILLCHYPRIVDALAPGAFHLVLAGHLHDGQITLPYPRRQAPARAPALPVPARALPPPGGDAARLAGARHDLRPVPFLRPARGDRARPRPDSRIGAWRGTRRSRATSSRATRPTRRARSTGVRGLVESLVHRHRGVRVVEDGRRPPDRAPPRARLGRLRRRRSGAPCRRASATTSRGWPTRACRRRRRRRRDRRPPDVAADARRPDRRDAAGRRRASATTASGGSRAAGRGVDKARWIEKAEEEWGAWGTVYADGDGRVLGSMQYGPAALFPRAAELPAGPPSDDAVLVTCAYLVDPATPWVLQSLFLAAIGDAKDKGAQRARGVRVPLPATGSRWPSASSSTARSSRATSSPTSASSPSAPPAASSSPGSSSAAC